MNFGGKCFLGRVVPTHNNFLEMDDGRGQKVSKQSVAQGLFVDLALTLLIVLALILPCVLVLALLWHCILTAERGRLQSGCSSFLT